MTWIQRQVNMRMRMAVMDGKDWARVPVTSWRLVRNLWAEFETEACVSGVWVCAQKPKMMTDFRLLMTEAVDPWFASYFAEGPSPSLEN